MIERGKKIKMVRNEDGISGILLFSYFFVILPKCIGVKIFNINTFKCGGISMKSHKMAIRM